MSDTLGLGSGEGEGSSDEGEGSRSIPLHLAHSAHWGFGASEGLSHPVGQNWAHGSSGSHWGHWSKVALSYSEPIGLSTPGQPASHEPSEAAVAQLSPWLKKTWQNSSMVVMPAYILTSQKSGSPSSPSSPSSAVRWHSAQSAHSGLPASAAVSHPIGQTSTHGSSGSGGSGDGRGRSLGFGGSPMHSQYDWAAPAQETHPPGIAGVGSAPAFHSSHPPFWSKPTTHSGQGSGEGEGERDELVSRISASGSGEGQGDGNGMQELGPA